YGLPCTDANAAELIFQRRKPARPSAASAAFAARNPHTPCTPPRVRGRAAEVEPFHRGLRPAEARHGPEHQLLEQVRRAAADRAVAEVGVGGEDAAPSPGWWSSSAAAVRSGSRCSTAAAVPSGRN